MRRGSSGPRWESWECTFVEAFRPFVAGDVVGDQGVAYADASEVEGANYTLRFGRCALGLALGGPEVCRGRAHVVVV